MASNSDDSLGTASSDHGLHLSEDQLSALAHFKDISGISEDAIAENILESNSWDLERAVHSFMGYGDPVGQSVRRRNVSPPTIDPSPLNQRVFFTPRINVPWYRQFISVLFSPVHWTCSALWGLFHFMLSFIWPDPRRVITDPVGDVRNFIENFRNTYAPTSNEDQVEIDTDTQAHHPRMPPFFYGTYADALKEAKQSLRFLIIYLHCDSHEDTDAFCRNTLLDPVFLDFIGNAENMIFWGCNINSPEGFRVSETFREHTYPFVGVVGLSSNPVYSSTSFGSPTRMALLGRIEGLTDARNLITQLSLIMDENQGVIVAERADRAERELSSRLRREQDEAFQASLEMDRAKARERAATAEAEARLAREAAEAERRKELLARAIARRQRRWAHSLPAEPAPVGSETVCLSIKLPNGSRAQRVFPVTDSIKHLYYFIISQEHAPKRFAVESNYPKRIVECRPGDESDIEEYVPVEDADDSEPMSPRLMENWKPSGPTDPPSFMDANLAQPQMLFVLDLDS